MSFRIVLALLLCCCFACPAFAQSADQQVVSAADSPDPVIPGQNLTYTVVVRNNGPDPAVNGGMNGNLSGSVSLVSMSAPPGFSCASFGNAISCTNPSFAAGVTATMTIVVNVPASLLNFPDGTLTSSFSTSGTTSDPNPSNNSAPPVVTSYDSPQSDLSMTVVDSPDPVGPDQDITYSARISASGPDTVTNVNFNVYNNNTLRFRSATGPGFFNCTLPAVDGAPVFTCTAPTLAPGNYDFTVVLRAYGSVLGGNDGSVGTVFGTNGTGYDPNQNNNIETESTAYVTPDADMAVSVVDSPDPAYVNGTITYTVTVQNLGPDPGSTAHLNVVNSGTLRFQSVSAPAGFSCVPPSVGSTPTFSCTNPSMAVGASAVFTVVVQADIALTGENNTTVSTLFGANSSLTDPSNVNNNETESTQLIALKLFSDGFE